MVDDVEHNWCWVLDSAGSYTDTVVWVDECSSANFVSPQCLRALGFQAAPTTTASFRTAMGDFDASRMIELDWKGTKVDGRHIFYVLPQKSAISGIIVGKSFVNQYGGDVFEGMRPVAPVLVTAASPMSVSVVVTRGTRPLSLVPTTY